MSSFLEIRPVRFELSHEDEHDEANGNFSQFFEGASNARNS